MQWLKTKVYYNISMSYHSKFSKFPLWDYLLVVVEFYTFKQLDWVSGISPSISMQLSNSIFSTTASFCIIKCKIWSPSCSIENCRPLSSTSSVALMSSRAFCYHWRHSDVARALSHHWCLGIGNPFWLFQSNRFFLLPHFFFILRRCLASAFFAGVSFSSLRRRPSHGNLLSLLNYFICQHLFKLLHSFTIFGHLTSMTWRISFPWKEAVLSSIALVEVHNSLLCRKNLWI